MWYVQKTMHLQVSHLVRYWQKSLYNVFKGKNTEAMLTSWKAWTPMLNLVSPRPMYCLRRSASKVPGSASMEISAPAAMPKRLSSALMEMPHRSQL